MWNRFYVPGFQVSSRAPRVLSAPPRESLGGLPVQITERGGIIPRESPDGKTVYFRRGNALVAKSLAGGAERSIVTDLVGGTSPYFPGSTEIYCLAQPDRSRPTLFEMRAVDLASSKIRTITNFEATSAQGLSVSPDGKTILLGASRSLSDLILVENFR